MKLLWKEYKAECQVFGIYKEEAETRQKNSNVRGYVRGATYYGGYDDK